MGEPHWHRYFAFGPSQSAQSKKFDMGEHVQSGTCVAPMLQRCHVSWDVRPNVPVRAYFVLPGGEEIGPIDIPLNYNVPVPFEVTIDVDAGLAHSLVVRVLTAAFPDSPNIWGAIYTVYPGRGNVPIPDAVIGFAVLSGATGTILNATPSAIGTFTGPYYVARPRGAVFVSVSDINAPIIFFY